MRTVKKNSASSKTARATPSSLKGREGETKLSKPNLRADGDRMYRNVVQPKVEKRGTVASAFRSAAGVTTNTKELVVRITDYLDYDSTADPNTPIRTYCQRVKDSIFANIADDSNPGCIFRKLKISALPQAVNANVANKTFLFQGGVLVHDKSIGGSYRLASTVNTVVKTDFNVEWINVGTFNYLSMFKDSNYLPYVFETGDIDYQDLVRYAIIDPDTGDGFGADNSVRVQLRFELEVAYPVAPANSVTVISGPTTTWAESITSQEAVAESTFATVNLMRLSDSR